MAADASPDDVRLSRALLLAVGERCSAVRGPVISKTPSCPRTGSFTRRLRRAGRPCCRSSTNWATAARTSASPHHDATHSVDARWSQEHCQANSAARPSRVLGRNGRRRRVPEPAENTGQGPQRHHTTILPIQWTPEPRTLPSNSAARPRCSATKRTWRTPTRRCRATRRRTLTGPACTRTGGSPLWAGSSRADGHRTMPCEAAPTRRSCRHLPPAAATRPPPAAITRLSS